MTDACHFDPKLYTPARQQTDGYVDFQFSPEAVFARVSDHVTMGEWFPLVKQITVTHPEPVAPGASMVGTARHIEFEGGLKIVETVVYWNPPFCYAYNATGSLFPLKNYLGLFSVEATTAQSGRFIVREWFDDLGAVAQAVVPHGAAGLFAKALANLSHLIGGTAHDMKIVHGD